MFIFFNTFILNFFLEVFYFQFLSDFMKSLKNRLSKISGFILSEKQVIFYK